MTGPDSYSPEFRTALVLTGTGTAGAYHAGVLRALHEAGVKLDIVAGRGVGAVGALFAAVDGGPNLWGEKGFWRPEGLRDLYEWRLTIRIAAWAVAAAFAIVALPLGAIALGAVVFPIDFVVRMVGLGGVEGLVGGYLRLSSRLFAAGAFPTWLPRLVVLILGAAAIALLAEGLTTARRRRQRGPFWWRVVAAPLSSREVRARCWSALWDLIRGAAQLHQPDPEDLARRYTELLNENFGQPGFRELLIAAHDLDAHRDLIFALVPEPRRRDLVRRATSAEAETRRAEVIDLAGAGRAHVADAIAAALSVPVVTEPHAMTFTPETYWRGETHRVCDRPGGLSRLLDELADLAVQQVVLVSAASELAGPHALADARLDGKGRVGEYVQSIEVAAVRDALQRASDRLPRIFTIRPGHNPLGPFDFDGGYDDRSDRRQPLAELIVRGYEDAYRQFIEPVVGASGERVGR
jgi:predicted acylesterase/phospholipase RssA